VTQAATSVPAPSTPTPVPTVGSAGGDLLALGKEVFEKKAGNVGCQACHGPDAKGVVGPNIRGKSADDIRKALKEVDLMMQTVKNLSDEDIEAVAAYLEFLTTQP
jgi:mono/diheme cytochrome c family protein